MKPLATQSITARRVRIGDQILCITESGVICSPVAEKVVPAKTKKPDGAARTLPAHKVTISTPDKIFRMLPETRMTIIKRKPEPKRRKTETTPKRGTRR